MYKSFRKRMEIEDCCRIKHEAGFIANGTSATSIYHLRLNKDREAGLVIKEKEGPDQVVVFTYKNDGDNSFDLQKGDYFFWNQAIYFPFEDIKLVRQTSYKKQWAYECNITIQREDYDNTEILVEEPVIGVVDDYGHLMNVGEDDSAKSLIEKAYHSLYINNYGDYSYLSITSDQIRKNLIADTDKNDLYFGYFVSSLKKYTDQDFSKSLLLTNAEKPILILPNFAWVKVGTRILAGGKPWRITNVDDITNPNICYCSLDFDFIDKQPNVAVEAPETVDDKIIVNGSGENRILDANKKLIMRLYDGYFAASMPVDITSKTATSITFIIPFGINEITITTKDDLGNEVIEKYGVV